MKGSAMTHKTFKTYRATILIAGLAASLVIAVSHDRNYFRLRAVDPSVTMEFG